VGVDCKFLNFGVNIAKSLKLHELKVNFSLDSYGMEKMLRLLKLKWHGLMYVIQKRRVVWV
jgi:hypothetical protein